TRLMRVPIERTPKSGDGATAISFRSGSPFASSRCAPRRSITSQCARWCSTLLPTSHVSLSGSGARGCPRTNASYVSFTSGHHAGPAIRHAGDDNVVLVDVVAALDGIDDRDEVERLVVAPPGRLGPRVRKDVDLLRARERADRAGTDRRVGAAAADAAVQLKPD